MKYTILFCLICIFRFAGFSTDVQPALRLIKQGDSLLEVKEFQQAGIVFDRAAYLAPDNIWKTKALMRKGDCYLMRYDYAAAEQCLNRITYFDLSDSLQFAARYKTALAAYLNASFENAESQLMQIRIFVSDTQLSAQALPLYALVLNETGRWEEARNTLLLYNSVTSNNPQLAVAIDSLYQPDRLPKLKDVEKAQKLSSIMPGTGQIYCGYWGEGLLSVSWQLLGLGITGWGIWKQYYASGVLIGFSIFQRFYMGGITRTEYLANKRNYLIKRHFNNSRKDFVIQKLMP